MAEGKQGKVQLAAGLMGVYLLLTSSGALADSVELTLADSIGLALKNNPSVTISTAMQESSLWATRQAEAGWGPLITFSNSDARAHVSSPLSRYSSQFDNHLGLLQPLYTGGLVEGLVAQAKLDAQISSLGLDKTKQQLEQNAITGYFSVLQARHLVEVDQQSVDDLSAHLDVARAQYQIGTIAKTDVLSAEVALANAQDVFIQEQNTYKLAIANLNNVLGLSLDTTVSLRDDLQHNAYPSSLMDCLNYAKRSNPDVQTSQINVGVAADSVKIAESAYRPTVEANASYNMNSQTFPGTGNNTWQIGLNVAWTVSDAGFTQATVEQAKTGVTVANQQLGQTGDTVALAVRQWYLSMKEAEKRIDTSKVAVDEAAENFMINTVKYKVGIGTNLDVMDAQLALVTAKTNYIQALYDYNTCMANLNAAMGTPVK